MTKNEQENEKTLDWYKAQAKELADIRRGLFPLIGGSHGDEYYPDFVLRKVKPFMPQEGKPFKGFEAGATDKDAKAI